MYEYGKRRGASTGTCSLHHQFLLLHVGESVELAADLLAALVVDDLSRLVAEADGWRAGLRVDAMQREARERRDRVGLVEGRVGVVGKLVRDAGDLLLWVTLQVPRL